MQKLVELLGLGVHDGLAVVGDLKQVQAQPVEYPAVVSTELRLLLVRTLRRTLLVFGSFLDFGNWQCENEVPSSFNGSLDCSILLDTERRL